LVITAGLWPKPGRGDRDVRCAAADRLGEGLHSRQRNTDLLRYRSTLIRPSL
jgi:hypothetical protein